MNNFKERVELAGGQEFIDKFIEEKKDEVKEYFLPKLRITYPIFEELEDEFRDCARGFTRVSKIESLFEWGIRSNKFIKRRILVFSRRVDGICYETLFRRN